MTPSEIIETIKYLFKSRRENQETISIDFFNVNKEGIIGLLKMMYPALNNTDTTTLSSYYETARKEYTSVNPVEIEPSSSLTKKDLKEWLTDERQERMPKDYIERYLKYLRREGRSEKVISGIEESSKSILSKLGDPQSPSAFYSKGLVVGSVQSGKTGNFNAVINRSIDAGYNLIIILSGIMEDLRSQTQLRLEREVIGEGIINLQTEKKDKVGVGEIITFGIQGVTDISQIFSITSHKSDFKKPVLDVNFSLNNKNILVCKKNTGVLKNLLIWLSDYLNENKDQHDIPLLIVDDEADNASLNNLGHKGREYASTINGHIRAILALFTRKTYLGYTATPFANVLQDQNEEAEVFWPITYKRNGEIITKEFRQVNNIFPDDFIELLSQPSNYIGAKQIFDTVIETSNIKIPLIEPVSDHYNAFPVKFVIENGEKRPATIHEINESKIKLLSPQKDDPYPASLPDSLKDAIKCFILTIAIRLKRKPSMANSKLYNPHNTMLVHISRFTSWQNTTRDLIETEVNQIIHEIETVLPNREDSIYFHFKRIWDKYYADIIQNIRTFLPLEYSDEFLDSMTFEEIKSLLPESVKGIDIKAINSERKEKLVFSTDSSGKGKKYIAIGGNRLSRGFTLEGLTINYFIRDTSYADTLLQMGRWFGYRPGYIDCCKLFTTWDAIEKFNSVTCTIEELELEFKKMHRHPVRKTPKDFILRVRTDPGVLKITRPSILKNTEEVNWSYQDKLVQTTEFEMNKTRIQNAWDSFNELISKIVFKKSIDVNGFYYFDTDINGLFSFLDAKNSFYKYDDEINQIKAFVNLCAKEGKLKTWRIAIKSTGASKNEIRLKTQNPELKIQLTVRSGPNEKSNNHNHRRQILEKGVFTASGKSANILSAGLDMALWLTSEEIEKANSDFESQKQSEIAKRDGVTLEEAKPKAQKLTKPERIYREQMSDTTGLLVIYLIDIMRVLSDDDSEMRKYKQEKDINDSIPLIGYAIGFPPISAKIGGIYVRGKYNITEDEPEVDEFDEETLNENLD